MALRAPDVRCPGFRIETRVSRPYACALDLEQPRLSTVSQPKTHVDGLSRGTKTRVFLNHYFKPVFRGQPAGEVRREPRL